MTTSSSVVAAQYGFDPYGRRAKLQGAQESDFQYASYYFHTNSGLNLTVSRAYNPTLGRWINRDPIGENGGLNLYGYVANEPIGNTDPDGTVMNEFNPWGPILFPQQPMPAPTPTPMPLRGYCQMGGGGLHLSGEGGGGGGGRDPFQKRKRIDDDLLDDAKYRDYWKKQHSEISTPFSSHRRYWPNGNIKSIQTYDRFGRRYSRFDLKDTLGSPEHRHNWSYGPGTSGGREIPHLPLDSVPD
ncbi:MAG TPA: RHS repeat-associated core domain-containing protein [Oculatellaceae cyanobacterium]